MGEFNNRHLDLITYSSICHAKTVLDLYTGNINKNIRVTYIHIVTKLKVSLLVKTCHLHYYIKRCEKHFNVIRLLNIKYKIKIILIKEKIFRNKIKNEQN